MLGSRGLRRMACSSSGITSSIDPISSLHHGEVVQQRTLSSDPRRTPSRIREWPPPIVLRPQHATFDEMCISRCAARPPRLARPALPRGQCRLAASSVIPSSTRPASALASWLCASTDCGLSVNACSNSPIASAYPCARIRPEPLPRVRGECSRAHRDDRSAGQPPHRSAAIPSEFASRLVISSCRVNRSPMSRSNRSAQRCASVSASISCAVTRTWLPDRWTLPSST